MKKLLKIEYLLYLCLLLVAVGCEGLSVDESLPSVQLPEKPKPVTPIKRRPIVPGGKVERPRFTFEEGLSKGEVLYDVDAAEEDLE